MRMRFCRFKSARCALSFMVVAREADNFHLCFKKGYPLFPKFSLNMLMLNRNGSFVFFLYL